MCDFRFLHQRMFNNTLHPWYIFHRLLITNLEKVQYFNFKESNPRSQRLYVWGCAEHGALGELKVRSRKTRFTFIHRPVRKAFAFSHQIADVACGYGFSLFAIKTEHKNKLFGCGINTDSQIGYHDPRRNHPLTMILSMVPIHLPLKSLKANIIKVAAGRAHSVALTDNEGIYLFGNNAHGQCGRLIVEDEDYTKYGNINHITDLDGKRIIDVVCGQDHSLFLTETGEVYSCGLGADGQTGLAHFTCEWNPTKVEGRIKDEFITKITSTTDSVLALNDKGQVFGWGNNEYFQLMTKDSVMQLCEPIHLKQLDYIGKIIDIAAGSTVCMALNENGEVFVWGYGILGKGPELRESDVPTNIPSTLFGKSPFQADTKVIHISCGVRSMMAITNYGELFTWGRNNFGQLGLGHCNNQMFPMKVSIGGKVMKVCCGIDHTIALCKPFV